VKKLLHKDTSSSFPWTGSRLLSEYILSLLVIIHYLFLKH
jgi:hypothetical protein